VLLELKWEVSSGVWTLSYFSTVQWGAKLPVVWFGTVKYVVDNLSSIRAERKLKTSVRIACIIHNKDNLRRSPTYHFIHTRREEIQ
jgi:hypothetical protein